MLYQGDVAIGTDDTPTPTGEYYVRVKVKAIDPNTVYGPYAWGLSSHSDALETFDGGDAEIGIHGNNDATVLGHDVTHGCVRMDNDAITTLTTTRAARDARRHRGVSRRRRPRLPIVVLLSVAAGFVLTAAPRQRSSAELPPPTATTERAGSSWSSSDPRSRHSGCTSPAPPWSTPRTTARPPARTSRSTSSPMGRTAPRRTSPAPQP